MESPFSGGGLLVVIGNAKQGHFAVAIRSHQIRSIRTVTQISDCTAQSNLFTLFHSAITSHSVNVDCVATTAFTHGKFFVVKNADGRGFKIDFGFMYNLIISQLKCNIKIEVNDTKKWIRNFSVAVLYSPW